MVSRSPVVVIFVFVVVTGLVAGLSRVMMRTGAEAAGAVQVDLAAVELTSETTIAQIAEATGIANPVLREAFGLRGPEDRGRTLAELDYTPEQARAILAQASAIRGEAASKNWRKIMGKFAAWAALLAGVFVLMQRRMISPKVRLALLAGAVLVFGVAFGPEQSPMGTVKDTIALWGRSKVIFPPRMIAFGIFLLMAIVANKYICGWGCQFGVLQDLIFRLNRDGKDQKGIMWQGKPRFVVSNAVRKIFFLVFMIVAFAWATDIIEPIDPFKIYSPQMIGAAGIGFIALILMASLFVYRPWCHFFCPFGVVGWLAEKISIYRIKVNYETCVACKKCVRACPSTVMGAILKQDREKPDCFACGVCIDTCPTKSISFGAGRQEKPPEGKFEKKVASL